MATLEQLAEQYANKILKSINKRNATKEVIESINSITYEKTKRPITQEDIIKLIKHIKDNLESNASNESLQEETFSKTYRNYDYGLGNTDTSGFNEIIDMITKGTKR